MTTTAHEQPVPVAQATGRQKFTFDWRRDIIYVGFVAVVIVFSILLRDQGFISTTSLLNILRQTTIVTVIAVGMTYVAVPCTTGDSTVTSGTPSWNR